MDLLGRIVRLQVQESSLKVGSAPQRYEPAAICVVPRLTLDADGVIGWTEQGERADDVHNRLHPATKNRRGSNGISIGFTAHYDAMRARFGDHLTDGIAGENILVRTERAIGELELADGIIVVTADGVHVRLGDVIVAEPCLEFSRYALCFPPGTRADGTAKMVKDALAFLRQGIRGYYAAYSGAPISLRAGDAVYRA